MTKKFPRTSTSAGKTNLSVEDDNKKRLFSPQQRATTNNFNSTTTTHPRTNVTRKMPDYGGITARIAQELEFSNIEVNGKDVHTERLERAKKVAAHNLAKSLQPQTWDNVRYLRQLSADELIDDLVSRKNFSGSVKSLKYQDRALKNLSSSTLQSCLEFPPHELDSTGGQLPSVVSFSRTASPRTLLLRTNPDFVNTKPYADEQMNATGAKSVSHLKHIKKLERLQAGKEWLDKDNTYMSPGVTFKRVNAFYRDSYVGRDGVSPVSDPYIGRQSLMKNK